MLPEGFATTEADLAGKQITLTAGDKAVTATYAKGSLNKKGEAAFLLDDKVKLADAVEYTATADWAKFATATFVAKASKPYAKTFEATTEKLVANYVSEAGAVTKVARTINFTAKNQYGEDFEVKGIDLEVEVTVNGMPLTVGESKEVTYKDQTITLAEEVVLKENDKVVIKVTNKNADKDVIGEGTFEYTVAAFEKPVPTKIAETKATIAGKDDATSVVAQDTVTLQAGVRDQFNTPVRDEDKSKNRTFTVSDGTNTATILLHSQFSDI